MTKISVVVASSSTDTLAAVIAEEIARLRDMTLVGGNYVALDDATRVVQGLPHATPCALILVGAASETSDLAQRLLAERTQLVVVQVEVIGQVVGISLHNPGLSTLLEALRSLVEHVGGPTRERFAQVEIRSVDSSEPAAAGAEYLTQPRPLLSATIAWVRETLVEAVEKMPRGSSDLHGVSVTAAGLLQSLSGGGGTPSANAVEADRRLTEALSEASDDDEPFAAMVRRLGLTPLSFRMLLLSLAPELDPRFQRFIGFLLFDMGRRVGTLGLYNGLLGVSPERHDEALAPLAQWLVLDGYSERAPSSDEPVRVDPYLARWLLGARFALFEDPSVRRVMRLAPWAGESLLVRPEDRDAARGLISSLRSGGSAHWIILGGSDAGASRALAERGSQEAAVKLLRIDASQLSGLDVVTVEDCARRVGRAARLTRRPLIVDLDRADAIEDDLLQLFLVILQKAGCRAALISQHDTRVIKLIGEASAELVLPSAASEAARVSAVQQAGFALDLYLSADDAAALARQQPLSLDALEHAVRLARHRPLAIGNPLAARNRLANACRDVASQRPSSLADRLEPTFDLDDVVLPPDRRQQLIEIVDNIRLASRVLDEWKFGAQLPYGGGVAAMFHGPSGVGKTMAAIGVTRRLNVQLLRLDLSRVVSKYIGDTEKNIDRAFTDAEQTGAAILIDEADALFGRRSEVKDAHDRYANIEVAFLLQRLEQFNGLAILTTNLRQNLDPAFLRRLRFIVEFPRPDVDAREQIWRQCLPDESHDLDDAAFRFLARRIDLTGGHIRQITLRAAFIAAAADERIRIPHIARAANAEFAKLGMPAVELEPPQGKKAA